MKTKNIKIPIIVLSCLMIASFAFYVTAQEQAATNKNIFIDSDQDGLSDAEEKTYGTDPHNPDTDGDGYSDGAEVKAGYDPLKPAPGDKLAPEKTAAVTDPVPANNLTKTVAQKISTMASQSGSNGQSISVSDVQQLVDDTINNSKDSANNLPPIDPSEIKIKKNTYKNLSPEKAKQQQKEDFAKYITSVSYILASNSPRPITSSTDVTSVMTSVIQSISTSISKQSSTYVNDLTGNAEKTLEQLKDIEVPEEFVDIHTKALQFAKYSVSLKDALNSTPDDPLSDLANLSKIEGFAESLDSFMTETQTKLDEYGLTYDDTVKKAMQSAGLPVLEDAPDSGTSSSSSSSSSVSN